MSAIKTAVIAALGVTGMGIALASAGDAPKPKWPAAPPLAMRAYPMQVATKSGKAPTPAPVPTLPTDEAIAPLPSLDAGAPEAAVVDAGAPAPTPAKPVDAGAPAAPKPAVVDAGAPKPAPAPAPVPAPVAPKPDAGAAAAPKPPAPAPVPAAPAAPAAMGAMNLRASDTADVYVDGKKVGPSPLPGFKVKVGPHKVRFDCYDSSGNSVKGELQIITVKADEELDVEYTCQTE